MRVSVKVKPSSSRQKVEKIDDNNYSVWVRAKPAEGKANEAVIEVLAEHFGTSRSKITLLKGRTSRQKVLDIDV